jgi:hypothetical protein
MGTFHLNERECVCVSARIKACCLFESYRMPITLLKPNYISSATNVIPFPPHISQIYKIKCFEHYLIMREIIFSKNQASRIECRTHAATAVFNNESEGRSVDIRPGTERIVAQGALRLRGQGKGSADIPAAVCQAVPPAFAGTLWPAGQGSLGQLTPPL